MQQWLDQNVLQINDNSHAAEYYSPVSDAFSEGNNLHLSPVGPVSEASGLDDLTQGQELFLEQSYVEQCLQSASLADLLQVASCTVTDVVSTVPAAITDSKQHVSLDSTENSASQLPEGQQKYVITHHVQFIQYNRFIFIKCEVKDRTCLISKPGFDKTFYS